MQTTQKKTRREVREKAMQVLYAYELSQEPVEMLVETIAGVELDADVDMYRFAQSLIYSVLNHRAETDKLIRDKAEHWDFDRIAIIDRILLRMGIVEFLYFPEIPVKVTINECVDIAKRYSTAQSGRFINGLLDSIQRLLVEQKRIKKEGRGRVDQ
jgi:transcription antitermination protein NusB